MKLDNAIALLAGCSVVLAGCSKPSSPEAAELTPPPAHAQTLVASASKIQPDEQLSPHLTTASAISSSAKRVTDRKENLTGKVMVLMYHKFARIQTHYDRGFAKFRKDLERFYKMGMRPVTITQYINNDMPLPPGATPVIITMDDSADTQFHILPNGKIDPNCGVGIWEKFAEEHPDFPVRGTFFVLPTVMWGQPKWTHFKVQWLKDHGSELGCHTWDHPDLRRLTDAQVESQLGRSLAYLARLGFKNVPFAYPYGIYPRHMSILKGFNYKGTHYKLTAGLTCDTDWALPPTAKKLNVYEIPRIEALSGPIGIGAFLESAKRGHVHLYVAG